MKEASANLTRLVKGRKLEELSSDWAFRMACQHGILIIAEACNNLPPELLSRYPEIPWKSIVNMGHRLRHEYFRIDLDILWDVLVNHLPALDRTAHKIIADLSQPLCRCEQDAG